MIGSIPAVSRRVENNGYVQVSSMRRNFGLCCTILDRGTDVDVRACLKYVKSSLSRRDTFVRNVRRMLPIEAIFPLDDELANVSVAMHERFNCNEHSR